MRQPEAQRKRSSCNCGTNIGSPSNMLRIFWMESACSKSKSLTAGRMSQLVTGVMGVALIGLARGGCCGMGNGDGVTSSVRSSTAEDSRLMEPASLPICMVLADGIQYAGCMKLQRVVPMKTRTSSDSYGCRHVVES